MQQAPTYVRIPLPDLKTRKACLEDLADRVNEDAENWPEPVVDLLLTVWAHSGLHGAQLREAFDDYREQLDRLHGVADGTLSWCEIEPSLAGFNRDEAAYEIQAGIVADALDTLINGVR